MQRYFTATHKNTHILKKSSSGGVFTAITDEWFSEYKDKAVVYGCVMDKNLNAVHSRAVNREERDAMCGSKYISSDTSDVFSCVLNDLEIGNFVLFSGTPCQISGLNSFLSVSGVQIEEQLITIEVLCHGVGSNAFFNDYISDLEKKYSSKAVSCKFRAKNRPGKSQDMEVVFESGRKYNAASTQYDRFYSAYIKNLILRPSCFECRFAKPERVADITVFDNWKEIHQGITNAGLSAVSVNSSQGMKWFEKSCVYLNYCEKNFDEIVQPNLISPTKKPSDYDVFIDIYKGENGYKRAQKYIGNDTFKGRFRSFAVLIIYKLRLTDFIKRFVKLIKNNRG